MTNNVYAIKLAQVKRELQYLDYQPKFSPHKQEFVLSRQKLIQKFKKDLKIIKERVRIMHPTIPDIRSSTADPDRARAELDVAFKKNELRHHLKEQEAIRKKNSEENKSFISKLKKFIMDIRIFNLLTPR